MTNYVVNSGYGEDATILAFLSGPENAEEDIQKAGVAYNEAVRVWYSTRAKAYNEVERTFPPLEDYPTYENSFKDEDGDFSLEWLERLNANQDKLEELRADCSKRNQERQEKFNAIWYPLAQSIKHPEFKDFLPSHLVYVPHTWVKIKEEE